jgi:hypothetical protein
MRVFVLGAGASHHAGYPLAAEMGNSLAAWANALSSKHQHRSRLEQIADLYGGLEDFEAVLADLMTCPSGSRAEALGVTRPYLLSDLIEALRDHFDAIRSTPAPLYDKLARVLRPGDFVITFNYDLGVERALHTARLWDIKTGYGFPIAEGESPVEVLKLHGSTNWRALLFGGMTGSFAGSFVGNGTGLGDRPVLFFRPDLEYLGYQDFVDPHCSGLETAASLPAMVMPALPKEFHFATNFGEEWKPFWDRLWQRAERAIETADEVVLIGYSMPTVDERARAMLLGAQNKTVRVSICCGEATANLEQEFRDHGFSGIQTVASTFDAFLKGETAGGDSDAGTAISQAAISGAGGKKARPEATINPAQSILTATARLRDDGMVIYSQENTPIQDRVLRLDQLRMQLSCNGAFSDNVEKFVSTLLATGLAEIRQQKLMTQFFTVG